MNKQKTTGKTSVYRNVTIIVIGFTMGVYYTLMWLNTRASQCQPLAIGQYGNKDNVPEIASLTRENNNINVSEEIDTTTNMVEYLFNTTRVLCWIVTNPANHLTKAIHIRRTWGRRCNKLLFISSEADSVLQTVPLPVDEGREYLWFKTKMGLKYIYDNHLDDADWFLKADDDTYVIMENLRYFLYQYSPDIPIYFGCKFDRYIKQGYMSGGAGYVLSKSALTKFITEAYDNQRLCNYKTIAEDEQLGFCMENIGVIAGDSRDEKGLERFIPLPPVDLYPHPTTDWYIKWVKHEPEKNVSCCSPHAISFHYIIPDYFYILEYFLYTLRPFGISYSHDKWPQKLNISQVYAAGIPDAEPLIAPPTTVDSIS